MECPLCTVLRQYCAAAPQSDPSCGACAYRVLLRTPYYRCLLDAVMQRPVLRVLLIFYAVLAVKSFRALHVCSRLVSYRGSRLMRRSYCSNVITDFTSYYRKCYGQATVDTSLYSAFDFRSRLFGTRINQYRNTAAAALNTTYTKSKPTLRHTSE